MLDSLPTFVQYALFIGIPLAFIAIVIYVFRPRARKRYQKDAEIPFANEKDQDKEK